MRVISGKCRGRKLISPSGREVRPTSDMVREALFDMAQALVPGATVLDLYAGSGALGIEALSRGAERALFVEQDPRNARLIDSNLELCGLADCGRVLVGDALRVLDSLKPEPRYDLVLADPPYALADDRPLLQALARCPAVIAQASIFLERGTACAITEQLLGLSLIKIKRYGKTSMRIYRKLGEGS